MSERVHTFGAHGNLVGVYTAPAPHRHHPDMPALVLLNAGLLHRVGPYRLHVDLARRAAARGFPAFRFDLTGVGDSDTPAGVAVDDDRYVADIRDALDELGRHHRHRRFVLGGLCSGADLSHAGTVADERVVGTVLLDGFGYDTLGARVRHWLPRVTNPARLARAARRRLSHRGAPSQRQDEAPQDTLARIMPPRDRVAAELRAALARGVRQYWIYTGGASYYRYAGQFRDMFPDVPEGRIDLDFLPAADHTFTLLGDRADLIVRVLAWLERSFALPTPRWRDEPGSGERSRRDDTDDATETFVF